MPASLIEALNEAFAKDPNPDSIAREVGDPISKFLFWGDITADILAQIWEREVVYFTRKYHSDTEHWRECVLAPGTYRDTLRRAYGQTYVWNDDLGDEELVDRTPEQIVEDWQSDTYMINEKYYIIAFEAIPSLKPEDFPR